ncbi:hypothetical protein SAMN05216327_114164 [Dyadobacter sp. SG02]|nr:hypothetical protein SAMN05216327_114164 [Dyadobacter sp. SG02]
MQDIFHQYPAVLLGKVVLVVPECVWTEALLIYKILSVNHMCNFSTPFQRYTE